MHESRPDGPVMFRPKKRYIEIGTVFAALVALGTLALVALLVYRATRVHVDVTGISDGAAITTFDAAALEVHFEFASEDEAAEAIAHRRRRAGRGARRSSARIMVWRPPAPLAEGDHTHRGGGAPGRVRRLGAHLGLHRRRHRPRPRPCRRRSTPSTSATAPASPGTVEDGAELTADGEAVEIDDDGAFTLRYERPPGGTGHAGGRRPGRQHHDRVGRGPDHLPGHAGRPRHRGGLERPAAPRAGILALIDQGRIDTVALDLKDEAGIVGYDTEVAPGARDRRRRCGTSTSRRRWPPSRAAAPAWSAASSPSRTRVLAQAAWAAGQTSR